MPITAVLIDGGYLLKRLWSAWGSDTGDPVEAARIVHDLALSYVGGDVESDELYRIFFYDCAPLDSTIVHPITKEVIELGETRHHKFRVSLHRNLIKRRKVSLRLGRLVVRWGLKPKAVKAMISGREIRPDPEGNYLQYITSQKQVDTKIGLDVASLSYKKQVSLIVLASADTDFVPVAKLARREGVDFILDPLGKPVKPELSEYVDLISDVPDLSSCLTGKESR